MPDTASLAMPPAAVTSHIATCIRKTPRSTTTTPTTKDEDEDDDNDDDDVDELDSILCMMGLDTSNGNTKGPDVSESARWPLQDQPCGTRSLLLPQGPSTSSTKSLSGPTFITSHTTKSSSHISPGDIPCEPLSESQIASKDSPISPSDHNPLRQEGSGISFRSKVGSLSRRRKISVPELPRTLLTLQEKGSDSPTIPGRPPLKMMKSSESFSHERSYSAPGSNWRSGPFGGAMMSAVTGPAVPQEATVSMKRERSPLKREMSPKPAPVPVPTRWDSIVEGTQQPRHQQGIAYGTPLSPILSPTATKPNLTLNTQPFDDDDDDDIPPEVPPKTPAAEWTQSPPQRPSTRSGRPSPTRNLGRPTAPSPTPLSAFPPHSATEGRQSPVIAMRAGSAAAHSRNTSEPVSNSARSASSSGHSRNASDTSVMNRGRPVRRDQKREHSRNRSEAVSPEAEPLPSGCRPEEAVSKYSSSEKQGLEKQAMNQAEKFEVLSAKDVSGLTREIRALDERCDYLRKTYKSLRASRQKLHGRMISYLKRGETPIFSRESLIKQEEALAELDSSIDDWILKLEQAENRRLRVRQKLLEHVAAAVVMRPAASNTVDLAAAAAESTPPRSPIRSPIQSPSSVVSPIKTELPPKAPSPDPVEKERREVESIKIYADGHVLNLFNDIEQAIGRMCEQAA